MPDARDVILKHIAAVNDRDSDADPWAADAELVAPGGQASGRDDVIGFLACSTKRSRTSALRSSSSSPMGQPQRPKGPSRAPMMACSTPPTVMSRRQDEPLSSGGRRSIHRRRHAEVRAPVLRPDGLSRPARSPPRLAATAVGRRSHERRTQAGLGHEVRRERGRPWYQRLAHGSVIGGGRVPKPAAHLRGLIPRVWWKAPNVKQPGFNFASPGGLVARVLRYPAGQRAWKHSPRAAGRFGRDGCRPRRAASRRREGLPPSVGPHLQSTLNSMSRTPSSARCCPSVAPQRSPVGGQHPRFGSRTTLSPLCPDSSAG